MSRLLLLATLLVSLACASEPDTTAVMDVSDSQLRSAFTGVNVRPERGTGVHEGKIFVLAYPYWGYDSPIAQWTLQDDHVIKVVIIMCPDTPYKLEPFQLVGQLETISKLNEQA
jgi:hypothetical protein